LWSANSGVKILFDDGLNVAYDENEKRGFVRLNLLSFIFTFGAVLIGVAFIVSVGIVPAIRVRRSRLSAFNRLAGSTKAILDAQRRHDDGAVPPRMGKPLPVLFLTPHGTGTIQRG
jgi:hypothetical protein